MESLQVRIAEMAQRLRNTRLVQAVPFQRSPTHESKETADTLDHNSIDEMIETGNEWKNRHKTKEELKTQWRGILIRHRFETKIALGCLFFLVLLLSCLLAAYKGMNEETSPIQYTTSAETDTTPWYKFSPWDGGSDSSGTTAKPTVADPSLPIDEYIKSLFPGQEDILQDTQSPQGKAYRWISQQDDFASKSSSTLAQRFALAVFYFSTGGGRVTATWNVCSAVPINQEPDRNMEEFTERCVVEDDNTICAPKEAFLECPEHHEHDEVPQFPRRRWLSEVSECNWFGISCNGNGYVEVLNLSQNGLEGELPEELGLVTTMKALILDNNSIDGTFPKWQGLSELSSLSISQAGIESTIPRAWSQWSRLENLNLAENQLFGTLSLPNQWAKLHTVDLSGNNLELRLDTSIEMLQELDTLRLSRNVISGGIPAQLTELKNLKTLDVSETQLTGPIPENIGDVSQLVFLNLQRNQLDGTLPGSLWALQSLQTLLLSENDIVGSLSGQIGRLTNLQNLSLQQLSLSGEIPAELGQLVQLEHVELQLNRFEGEVPPEICSISVLSELQADCDGRNRVECECCTLCCRNDNGRCREE